MREGPKQADDHVKALAPTAVTHVTHVSLDGTRWQVNATAVSKSLDCQTFSTFVTPFTKTGNKIETSNRDKVCMCVETVGNRLQTDAPLSKVAGVSQGPSAAVTLVCITSTRALVRTDVSWS